MKPWQLNCRPLKTLWQVSCDRLTEFEVTLLSKDREIALVRQILRERSPSSPASVADGVPTEQTPQSKPGKGKALPVEMFARNDPEVHLDDWLPSLSRAATWNKWFSEELLIQLAGHLKGRALQEWNLLGEDQISSYDIAIQALRDKLDPGSKVLAGQDFRHTAQLEGETVADFIRHLECAFQVAYGRDRMSAETKETILFGQLLEGLRMKLLRGPAVSGALGYKEVCAAAKTEEHRLAELRKCQGYQRQAKATSAPKQPPNISWGEIGPDTQVIPKRRHLVQLRQTWTHCTGLLVPKEREHRTPTSKEKCGSSEGRGEVCRSSRRQAPKLNLRWW